MVLVFPAMYSMVSNWGFTFAESAFIFQSISLPVKAEIQAMVYPLYYKITADNTGILTKWMQTTDWSWLAQSTFLETRNFKAHLSAGFQLAWSPCIWWFALHEYLGLHIFKVLQNIKVVELYFRKTVKRFCPCNIKPGLDWVIMMTKFSSYLLKSFLKEFTSVFS